MHARFKAEVECKITHARQIVFFAHCGVSKPTAWPPERPALMLACMPPRQRLAKSSSLHIRLPAAGMRKWSPTPDLGARHAGLSQVFK
jgi:hypothetical protein